ncbi:type II toxin-antitoxin system HicB family antitoxin [Lyngbya sp. CCY1209]|uniref:type II toxin-antitoxin system HicB family antitoxin n=1 Tax=Lyngbya sp. CCY1209 TaxID=2886103 RepID=UPI002D1FC991|nr:type II toxin-antitoxin system HicB family antitoxin [Lyngbya sp. CCY1209]MEB3884356.1 type II toxin-antitoxin system HicB family antitoxin [Lyngbya sp. CCY1209]
MKNQQLNYTIIIEKGTSSYGAYVPDLPGCVAVGETKEEALQLIQEAILFHLEDLQSSGQPIPEPISTSETVSFSIANIKS